MFLDQDLRPNTEYRMRWADRVQKHLFNGGQLSAAKWTARFNSLASIVDSAIVAESARWGDAKTAVPLNRVNWLGATGKYKDDGSNQGTAWRAPAFNDTAWTSGAAELGYGDGDETTVVGGGPVGARYATTYFRKTITVANANQITAATLHIRYDDTAVVYVNGTEVARTAGLPADPAFDFYASGVSNENAEADFAVQPSALVSGANTIAVEIHQRDPTSSDVSFDFSLNASRTSIPAPYFIAGSGVKNLRVRACDSGTESSSTTAPARPSAT